MIGAGAAAGRGLAGTADSGYHGADDPRGPEEPPALPEEGGTLHTGSRAPWPSAPGSRLLGSRLAGSRLLGSLRSRARSNIVLENREDPLCKIEHYSGSSFKKVIPGFSVTQADL